MQFQPNTNDNFSNVKVLMPPGSTLQDTEAVMDHGARMITPLIAAYFLKAHGTQPHAAGKTMERYLRLLRWSIDSRKAERYRAEHPGRGRAVLSMFRDHRVWMVGVGFLSLLLSAVLIATLPMQFQPNTNDNFSNV
jgi:multidrug efflux pump subunit AcrB